jgi:hypothetical protein
LDIIPKTEATSGTLEADASTRRIKFEVPSIERVEISYSSHEEPELILY